MHYVIIIIIITLWLGVKNLRLAVFTIGSSVANGSVVCTLDDFSFFLKYKLVTFIEQMEGI